MIKPLPNELIFVENDDFNQVADAIKTLVIRDTPDDIEVISQTFDMTPPELISRIITEKGVWLGHHVKNTYQNLV